MQSILDDESLRFAGAAGMTRSPSGVTPRRLPAWAAAQIVDPNFRYATSAASGVRITFASDTDAVEVDAMLRGIEWPGMDAPAPRFDLAVDGAVVATQVSREGGRYIVDVSARDAEPAFRPGPPSHVRFAGLGRAMKRIEVWLPQACLVEVRDVRVDDGARIEAATPQGRRWLHYGSSISQCNEADGPTQTWPAVAARLAGVDLTSMGFAGQCHLDQNVARTIRDAAADVISIKVGINIINGDTMRERAFVPALHGFLDTVRDGHPDVPILVISPILFPAGEEHPGPSILVRGTTRVVKRPNDLTYGALTIGRIRELIAMVVAQRRRAADTRLSMLDGRELFGEADLGDLPDGLHPNTAGYARMGERFARLAFGAGGALADRAYT